MHSMLTQRAMKAPPPRLTVKQKVHVMPNATHDVKEAVTNLFAHAMAGPSSLPMYQNVLEGHMPDTV